MYLPSEHVTTGVRWETKPGSQCNRHWRTEKDDNSVKVTNKKKFPKGQSSSNHINTYDLNHFMNVKALLSGSNLLLYQCMFAPPRQGRLFHGWVCRVSCRPTVRAEQCLAWDRICLHAKDISLLLLHTIQSTRKIVEPITRLLPLGIALVMVTADGSLLHPAARGTLFKGR